MKSQSQLLVSNSDTYRSEKTKETFLDKIRDSIRNFLENAE